MVRRIALGIAVAVAAATSSLAAEPMSFRSVKVGLPPADRAFPGGPEADAINANCLACHSAGMVLTQPRLARAQWQAEVDKMIHTYKAPVDQADVPAIVAYLASMDGGSDMEAKKSGSVTISSAQSFDDTVGALRTALEAKGFTIFATIDHRAGALSVGLDMPPTTVLVFGNPRGGTPLMLAAPDFALELPLRVLVREDGHRHTWVTYNSVATLEGKHGLPPGMAERLAPAEKVIAEAVSAPPSKSR